MESLIIDKKDGCFLMVQVLIDGKMICMINVYAPNEDDPNFFDEIFQKVENISVDHILMMGDFNVWLNPILDKKGGTEQRMNRAAETVNNFLDQQESLDVWQTLNQNKFCFTWKRKHPMVMSCLDYVLAPINTAMLITKCQILPAYMSDHCPILCELTFDSTIQGPGLWKFNTRHLENKEYVEKINTIIDSASTKYINLDSSQKWKMLKHDIRQYTISYSCYAASQKRKKITTIRNKLKAAHKKLAMINLSSDKAVNIIQKTNDKIDILMEELNKIELEATRGAILQSKARYLSMGEHCMKYFFGLEKSNACAKTMTATTKEKGVITHDSTEILKIQAKFYKQLYTKDENIKCTLKDSPPVKISNEKSQELEQPLSLEELEQAVRTTAQNKSPGTSGFQINLYIVFWLKLKHFLLDAFNFAFKSGRLSTQQREGIISLIPKKDRDLKFVRNWRPIIL